MRHSCLDRADHSANLITNNAVHTGEKIGVAQWGAEVMAETGGDFLLMKVSPAYDSVTGGLIRIPVVA